MSLFYALITYIKFIFDLLSSYYHNPLNSYIISLINHQQTYQFINTRLYANRNNKMEQVPSY